MCVEVRKRGVTLTDNRYLNSYLTSMNCVRGKEHNILLHYQQLMPHDLNDKLRPDHIVQAESGPPSCQTDMHQNKVKLLQNHMHSLGECECIVIEHV